VARGWKVTVQGIPRHWDEKDGTIPCNWEGNVFYASLLYINAGQGSQPSHLRNDISTRVLFLSFLPVRDLAKFVFLLFFKGKDWAMQLVAI
jgi:hypothetical protein